MQKVGLGLAVGCSALSALQSANASTNSISPLMGLSKEHLLARLQELQIEFSKYEHPVVLTVEAQAKYVGHLGGGLSKNLFLKDKKNRFYVVSALADTKVDLKVLSQRLGLGKGGLRMAPEEALGEILQVPLGCVTPFALVNDSARDVSLLLDQGFKTQEHCFFHPLSNDMSISLNARDLDKFLKSIGRDPSYVDLEANPAVGKDQPPDLAALVPSGSISLPDQPEKQSSSQVPKDGSLVSVDNRSKTVSAKVVKPSVVGNNTKATPAKNVHPASSFADVGQFVEEILHKTSELLLSEIKEETIRQHGEPLGTVVSEKFQKNLSSDLKNLAMIFKNTAYTEGFHAGTHHQPRRL
ncbi:YbaK/aminoacyl-tRNA synthetase-associated domain [Sesbania bispinosa]|nr:YbaK/aminoacyl-tRNA synthetase-associated domain [Sesbania bispinosa]